MRFLHCSDLHIGRRINGYSLAEDQVHILDELCRIADEKDVDAVLIAGDVYDTSTPSDEATGIFNDFVTRLAKRPVYVVAGNHDSVWKLSFGKDLLRKANLFVTGSYSGKAEKFETEDGYGKLNIFLLPYTKTSIVRAWCRSNGIDDSGISTPDEAFSFTLDNSGIDPDARNILVAHEFVTGKGIELSTSDSEIRSLDPVGGADCISSRLLDAFDYVALGHIHRPQKAGRDTVLYCGSPLKYSASEIGDEKHAVIADVGPKGEVSFEFVPLTPLRDMVRIRGTVDDILADPRRGSYLVAEVTERAEKITDRLSEEFRIVEIRRLYETGTGEAENRRSIEEMKSETPEELFVRFFRDLLGKDLTETQLKYLRKAIGEVDG